MNGIIYTNENDCQDCYKCVRRCPVKAISMISNHASIDEDRCIMCGKCIEVCPVGAQKYRRDADRVKALLESDKKVIMAIAPAFPSEFDCAPSVLIDVAKRLGFYGVSETALGAQIVTYFQRELLKESDKTIFSTACPTFVQLIMKHFPAFKKHLSPLLSPLLSQCTMLRKVYGDDIAVVFVGPCLAKKFESDLHPELLDVAITFDEFRDFVDSEGLKFSDDESFDDNSFIPIHGNGGAIYPLDGGMVETIKSMQPSSVADTSFFNYAGLKTIKSILESENFDEKRHLFCEFLTCDGGCINGSGIFNDEPILTKKYRLAEYFKTLESYSEEEYIEKYAPESIETKYDFCEPVEIKDYSDKDKSVVWAKLGKFTPEDFTDCGACGYDTCNNFAVACLENRAELDMCATCMRQKANNKMKTFMEVTPLAICVVDESHNIVECNRKFIELSVDVDIDVTDELTHRVTGSEIDKFFPISGLIDKSDSSGENRPVQVHKGSRIFSVLIFSFDNKQFTGLIIEDITKPSVKRDVIISKAQDVIKNNLLNVQKIAFLLGETASETEITLNEIVNAYKMNEEK